MLNGGVWESTIYEKKYICKYAKIPPVIRSNALIKQLAGFLVVITQGERKLTGEFKNSTVWKRVLFNTWQHAPGQNIATVSPVPLQRADTRSPRQQYSVLFIAFSIFPVSIRSYRELWTLRGGRRQWWWEETTQTRFVDKMQMMRIKLKVLGNDNCISSPSYLFTQAEEKSRQQQSGSLWEYQNSSACNYSNYMQERLSS